MARFDEIMGADRAYQAKPVQRVTMADVQRVQGARQVYPVGGVNNFGDGYISTPKNGTIPGGFAKPIAMASHAVTEVAGTADHSQIVTLPSTFRQKTKGKIIKLTAIALSAKGQIPTGYNTFGELLDHAYEKLSVEIKQGDSVEHDFWGPLGRFSPDSERTGWEAPVVPDQIDYPTTTFVLTFTGLQNANTGETWTLSGQVVPIWGYPETPAEFEAWERAYGGKYSARGC